MLHSLEDYRQIFERYLSSYEWMKTPDRLYKPLKYFMSLGGKRIRPAFTLLGCDLFGGNCKDALSASMSVELFHNFSLIHDDIMDKARLRRGKSTVHVKYNSNQAILSGDVMLILAYKHLENLVDFNKQRSILSIFNQTAQIVCEGQQMDIDFEENLQVTQAEYIEMITKKTAVLLGAALVIGAIIGGADEKNVDLLKKFGIHIGIAFQIKDDLLDVFGSSDKTGKIASGDIYQNKKTLLFIFARNLSNEADRQKLLELYRTTDRSESKIESVVSLFNKYHIREKLEEQINYHLKHAILALQNLDVNDESKSYLNALAFKMVRRNH